MSGNDYIVAVLVILLVVAAMGYLVHQRRKGVSSCGCKTCNRCKSGPNVRIEDRDGGCDRCGKR